MFREVTLITVGLFLFGQVWCKAIEVGDDAVLEIPQGKLIGEWRKSLDGRMYAAYESIPFARPPVGKRRFLDPQKAKKWYGILQAKRLPPKCIQWKHNIDDEESSVIGQEDCLYLNVYSPQPLAGANLPVIVYIHGGAFLFDSAVEDEARHIMDKDVVYVSVSYRLGALGFLTTEDNNMPGNLGLKDQSMSLRWVQNYINHFGGNPLSVTLTGLSAGGASVHFHMLSPMSKGLFHKAISMSGTAFCPWTMQENAREKAMLIGDAVGCPTVTSKEMVDCLKHKPAYHIVKAIKKLMPWHHAPFSPVGPVVESYIIANAFLTQHPYDIVQRGAFNSVPWITSVTEHEGLYPAAIYLSKPEFINIIEEQWLQLSPFIFDYNYTIPLDKHNEVAMKIKQQYLNNEPLTGETYQKFTQALSDRIFVMDIVKAAKLQAITSKHPIYFYYFRYQGADSLSKVLSNSDKVLGVSHADDTAYVINVCYMNTTTSEEDKKMVKFMINIWASFAAEGVPKIEQWEPVEPNQPDIKYLEIINSEEYSMKTQADMGQESFWNTLGFNENEFRKKLPQKTEL